MMSPDQRHLDRESRSAELGTVPIKPNMSSGLTAPRPCTAGLCLIRCRLQRVPRRGFLRLSRTPIRGCRLLGWNSIYVPSPAAPHRYRVTAERRSTLPKDINHSVKNRFVLRLKSIGEFVRPGAWQITRLCLAIVWAVLLRECSSIPAFLYLLLHFPRHLRSPDRFKAE